ncbi:PREDICTED: uncharacterized protein LOC104728270 [Camelina sativa]|uniref:Uncharacterized protein LOC104728270 n=1 Tax=Camelina sativa TaxID=90675 RepID=A0ABM1QX61_CAMSA|nr:PREDICTED: uncharacterized protein LOC104728270 [Camelina sativa]
MECNKDEAKRAMDVAERKVKEKDYNGAKRFANKAQNLFPDLGGLKQLLTAIDVYISAEKQICGAADWYGILGVDPTANAEAMKKQYRKLLLMLHPDKNNADNAKGAYDLVSEAWDLLSNETRRTSYDEKRAKEVQKIVPTTQSMNVRPHRPTSSRSTPHAVYEPVILKPPVRTNLFSTGSSSSTMPEENINFWTKCGICRTIYQYPRDYVNKHLLCLTCKKGFIALEIPPPPSTVPKPPRKSSKKQASTKKSTGPSSSTRREPAAPPSVNPIFQWDFSSGTAGSSSGNATNQAENVVRQAQVKRKRGESQEKDTAIKRSKKDESHMRGQTSARNVVASGSTETPNNVGGSRRHPHVPATVLPDDVVDKVLMERGQSEILRRLPKMMNELEEKVRVTEGKKKRMKATIKMSGKKDEVKKSVDKVKIDDDVIRSAETNDEVVIRSAERVETNNEVVRSDEKNDEVVVRSAEEEKTNNEVVRSDEKNDEVVVRSAEEVKTNNEVVRSDEKNDEVVVRSAEEVKTNNEVVRSDEKNDEVVVRSAEEVKRNDEVIRSDETNGEVVKSAEEVKIDNEVIRSAETNDETVRSAKTNDEIVRSTEEVKMDDEVVKSAEEVKMDDEAVRSTEEVKMDDEVVKSAEKVKMDDEVIRSAEEVKTIIVPDSDFHNFDLDRSDFSFKEDQIWAAYDNDDGMPRFYAWIEKVISLEPFKMYIRWLSSKSTSEFGHIDWIGSGFIKTCGEFTSGRYEATNTKSPFSHKVECTNDVIRGLYFVLPKTGQVWALYRNWSPEWDKNTPEEVKHKYEIVQVLDDYTEDKQSVSVALLIKAEGFKTVFRRSIDGNNVREIPKEEMLRFSHQVPHYILTGKEADNAPEGCLELDPAATPLEFFAEEADGNEKSEADNNAPEGCIVLDAAEIPFELFSEEAYWNERSEAVQEESYVPDEFMDMDFDDLFDL